MSFIRTLPRRISSFFFTPRREINQLAQNLDPKPAPPGAPSEIKKPGTWISYGFYEDDEYMDKHAMHQTLFVTISLMIMGAGYIFTYLPDFKDLQWAEREGYLELRRREKLGLPLIDPNFIDPSKFTLPTDEELKDREIII